MRGGTSKSWLTLSRTPENVKLFYDAVQSKLTLYDATSMFGFAHFVGILLTLLL